MGSLRRVLLTLLLPLLLSATFASAQSTLAITSGPNYGTVSIGEVQAPLTASGGSGTGYAFSVLTGSLPPGISLRTDLPSFFPATAAAGLIGLATTPGTYNFTLLLTDSVNNRITQAAT